MLTVELGPLKHKRKSKIFRVVYTSPWRSNVNHRNKQNH